MPFIVGLAMFLGLLSGIADLICDHFHLRGDNARILVMVAIVVIPIITGFIISGIFSIGRAIQEGCEKREYERHEKKEQEERVRQHLARERELDAKFGGAREEEEYVQKLKARIAQEEQKKKEQAEQTARREWKELVRKRHGLYPSGNDDD